jgi:large subunit ribosomal protein L6
MSKIGRQPIPIPEGVEVKIEDHTITVKGPKGELSFSFHPAIKVVSTDNEIKVSQGTKEAKALWGTTRALIFNMVKGVTEGFKKQLEIHGVGYKAEVQDKKLILSVGFTHPVEILAPEGIEFKVEKNIITVSGIDKQLVGQIAAKIRAVKPPEPYKGKGIRYLGEHVRIKPGKKAVAAEGEGGS